MTFDWTHSGSSRTDGLAPVLNLRTEGSTPSAFSFDGRFVLHTWIENAAQSGGEPVIPARWDDVERLLTDHLDRNSEAFQRLA